MSQIHWLSKLALSYFKILYRLGKTNKAADALSQCPGEPEFEMVSVSDNDSEDPVMLTYATICDTIKLVLGDTKIPFVFFKKKEVQAISKALEGEIVPQMHEVPNLTVQTSAVSVFDQVSPATMAKAQAKDSVLELIIQYMHKGKKPKGLTISEIRCMAVQKYLM